MIGLIKRLFGGGVVPGPAHAPAETRGDGLAGSVSRAAAEFASRCGVAPGPEALSRMDELLAVLPPGTSDEGLLSEAAAYLGESVRLVYKGFWKEDDLLGLVLHEVGTVPLARLVPLAVVEARVARGDRFSVTSFAQGLPERLDNENQNLMYLQMPAHGVEWFRKSLRGLAGEEADHQAARHAADFQHFWADRFKDDIAISLAGLVRLDAFLRSHFHVFALHEETLIGAGFILGEAIRGLHGGSWDFGPEGDPTRAALVYPELPILPIGRIYKMVTTRPEGDSLEEFARLVPDARRKAPR